jgi:EAL domain-containing protein (putative c-di-GMP-specific phosphodiesterase class I)
MIQAVTSIARDSGVRTIAEFIESESARQLLQDLGVDDGQGWHLGRPMPAQIWAEERPAA